MMRCPCIFTFLMSALIFCQVENSRPDAQEPLADNADEPEDGQVKFQTPLAINGQATVEIGQDESPDVLQRDPAVDTSAKSSPGIQYRNDAGDTSTAKSEFPNGNPNRPAVDASSQSSAMVENHQNITGDEDADKDGPVTVHTPVGEKDSVTVFAQIGEDGTQQQQQQQQQPQNFIGSEDVDEDEPVDAQNGEDGSNRAEPEQQQQQPQQQQQQGQQQQQQQQQQHRQWQ
mmetsp:Transcript_104688/g.191152  ORF Transcript_104688/g.191152 Transcript_104688/m.191152 type:complete len:230 (+) Transcript_104688:162-851(+)